MFVYMRGVFFDFINKMVFFFMGNFRVIWKCILIRILIVYFNLIVFFYIFYNLIKLIYWYFKYFFYIFIFGKDGVIGVIFSFLLEIIKVLVIMCEIMVLKILDVR